MKLRTLPWEVLFTLLIALYLFGAYLDHLDQAQQECWQRQGDLIEGICSVPVEPPNPVNSTKGNKNGKAK